MMAKGGLVRNDQRIIIHFDYDCFYASVFEAENPQLKSLPLAVQQKQIIVTCNYEARRRGLYKLQLITEARKTCPDVIIVLGEDLTRFRDASKALYNFLRNSIWSGRAERLGFDEVFLDCTDMIDYNVDLLNHNDLAHSFLCLDKDDPTVGFQYDASHVFGPTFPPERPQDQDDVGDPGLSLRLVLASHLARHIRHQLEEHHGYTATVGVSTNKLLSKLVGNVNKPKNQTTLIPPYEPSLSYEGSPIIFLDGHDIGKIPGIGFKTSQKIRELVLRRPAAFADGLVYGGTRESVKVKDVRLFPGANPKLFEETLGGPGAPKGIGGVIWGLLHGVDDTEVAKAKIVPSQISIEDSYIRLDTFEQVRKELLMLTHNLIRRMQLDLTELDEESDRENPTVLVKKRWLAHPKTLRLSTRPRLPLNPGGTRPRTFNRISRSCPLPNFVLNLSESPESLAEKLVDDTLIPNFKKLHPERSGWNLSLVNVAVTNMAETAADSKTSEGRDIGRMFKRQDIVLKDYKVIEDGDNGPNDAVAFESPAPDDEADQEPPDSEDATSTELPASVGDEVLPLSGHGNIASQTVTDQEWEDDGSDEEVENVICPMCHEHVPVFALDAHMRYHDAFHD